jgi:hypothetical protein
VLGWFQVVRQFLHHKSDAHTFAAFVWNKNPKGEFHEQQYFQLRWRQVSERN